MVIDVSATSESSHLADIQIRYPGPDGRMRTGPETFERKGDAERALVLIEAQISAVTGPIRNAAKIKLGDYASLDHERPGLRPRTSTSTNGCSASTSRHYLGGVPLGKLSTPLIREWRATLLGDGRFGVRGG